MAAVWRPLLACAALFALALVPSGLAAAAGPASPATDGLALSVPLPESTVPPPPAVPAGLPTADLPTADLPVVDLPVVDLPVVADPPVEAPVHEPPARPGPDIPGPDAPVAAGAGIGLLALLAFLALKAAGLAPGAGLFSRISQNDVLDHTTRTRILDLVASRPGIHMKEAQGELGIAWGTLVHHVRRLEATQHLVSIRQGPRRLLYAANTPEARARQELALLRNGTARRIAATVQSQPGMRQGDVCAALELNAAAVSKHIARLEEAGLVLVPRDDGRPRYLPSERLGPVLALAPTAAAAA